MEDTFDKALFDAKLEMKRPDKDATNPAFRSRYSTLPNVLDSAQPALARHGVMLSFDTESGATGEVGVVTVLTFVPTGETRRIGWVPIVGAKKMQEVGSALTYAQRYSLSMSLALPADDDDDGNLASKMVPAPTMDQRKSWMLKHSKDMSLASGIDLDAVKRMVVQDFPDWQTCDGERWAEIKEAGAAMVASARETGKGDGE